jgi:hypothetical protein
LRGGAVTLNTTATNTNGDQYRDDIMSFYAPDKDVPVYIDLYGGAGQDYPYSDGSFSKGGKGGYGRISMTLKRNQEYVVAGLSTHTNTPYLYEGGTLLATVGQGGDAGRWGAGGDGGSFSSGGETASGIGGGTGAHSSSNNPLGPITGNGTFGSTLNGILNSNTVAGYGDQIAGGRNGGKTLICSKGTYWRQQGKGACDSLGTGKFRTSNGTQISNTASITRGFKAGYNIQETSGVGQDGGLADGNGGCGAYGGDGATNQRGGGGGSGFKSSAVTVVSEQSGLHDDLAKLVIRLR